jgi:hypothetical protein
VCRQRPRVDLIHSPRGLPTVYRIKKLKKEARVQQWAVEPMIIMIIIIIIIIINNS